MLRILSAVLEFEDLRESFIDWILSLELFYQHNMALKVSGILAKKAAEGSLTRSKMMNDPAMMRLMIAT